MTAQERFAYRGYDILPKWQWGSWCVSIYATRSDLPLLAQSTLQILRAHKQDTMIRPNTRLITLWTGKTRSPSARLDLFVSLV